MDEISKSLARSVHNGEYFKEAKQWFAYRYLYPYTERSILLLMTIVLSLAALVLTYNLYYLFPIKKEVPFIIKSANVDRYAGYVLPLAKPHDSATYAVAKYLLGRYIEMRESYAPRRVDQQMEQMRNLSSKQIFKDFNEYMSVNNPQSPLLRYDRSIIREIIVENIHLSEDQEKSQNAKVTFMARELRYGREEINRERFQANVTFNLPTIGLNYTDDVHLGFIVTDYEVKKLGED